MALPALAARAGIVLAAGQLASGPRHIALASGWLTDATWDSGTLTLTMNGNNYDYPDGDGSLFEGISNAPSPGQFYNRQIKGSSGNTGNRIAGTARTGLLAAGRFLTRGFTS